MATEFSIDDEPRMYMVVRCDIPELPWQKLLGQAGHAILMTWYEAFKRNPEKAIAYVEHPGQGKIALKGKTLDDLEKAKAAIQSIGIPCLMIADAGRTHLPPGTVTMLGIGPTTKREAQPALKRLQLLDEFDLVRYAGLKGVLPPIAEDRTPQRVPEMIPNRPW